MTSSPKTIIPSLITCKNENQNMLAEMISIWECVQKGRNNDYLDCWSQTQEHCKSSND